MNTFGKLLDTYIQRKQILKQDVAAALKIDPSYLAKILSGERHPPGYEQFEALTALLGLSKSEELDLAIASIHQKTPLRIKPFVDKVRQLSTDAKHAEPIQTTPAIEPLNSAVTKHIPIISLPDKPVHFPYPPKLVLDYFINNEIINEDFYAIRFDTFKQSSSEFRRNDLLLFTPYYKSLKSGDFVLVKINGVVSVKKYLVLEVDSALYVEFHPLSSKNRSPIKLDDKRYVIFSKLVFSVKGY